MFAPFKIISFVIIFFKLAEGRSQQGSEAKLAPSFSWNSGENGNGKIVIVNPNSASNEERESRELEHSKEKKSMSNENENAHSNEGNFAGGICCEKGWVQFKAKCYLASNVPVPFKKSDYFCYEQEGYAYPLRDFDNTAQFEFLASKWDLAQFWTLQNKYSGEFREICYKNADFGCPERIRDLEEWSANKDEEEKAIKAKGGRCCEKGWTLIKGICYRTFSERIKFYEEPMKCEGHGGAKLASVISLAVDEFVEKELGSSNKYAREDYGSRRIRRGYACQKVSKECGGEK